jgi:hypothetical protein
MMLKFFTASAISSGSVTVIMLSPMGTSIFGVLMGLIFPVAIMILSYFLFSGTIRICCFIFPLLHLVS